MILSVGRVVPSAANVDDIYAPTNLIKLQLLIIIIYLHNMQK